MVHPAQKKSRSSAAIFSFSKFGFFFGQKKFYVHQIIFEFFVSEKKRKKDEGMSKKLHELLVVPDPAIFARFALLKLGSSRVPAWAFLEPAQLYETVSRVHLYICSFYLDSFYWDFDEDAALSIYNVTAPAVLEPQDKKAAGFVPAPGTWSVHKIGDVRASNGQWSIINELPYNFSGRCWRLAQFFDKSQILGALKHETSSFLDTVARGIFVCPKNLSTEKKNKVWLRDWEIDWDFLCLTSSFSSSTFFVNSDASVSVDQNAKFCTRHTGALQ